MMLQASVLPLLLVAGPPLAALALGPLGRRSEAVRDVFMVAVTALALLGAAALVPLVTAHGAIHAEWPLLPGGLVFKVDHFGALFALFSAFVWFCATLYSLGYLRAQPRRNRFHAASLVVLAANLGVVLAGNLVTLFVFFELLGLVAFLLVVHAGTAEAKRAAVQYFWMTLLGGFALLAGVMIIVTMGDGTLTPIHVEEGQSGLRSAAAVLLLIGFGVKAGMVPLHVWLPNAHPVAPSPASALLSGVMIKAGAYGIFRCLSTLFRPGVGTDFADPAWQFSSVLGLAVVWLGILTMAVGVVLALGQRNAKRMLAYHSISQVGFILVGIGAGAYLLEDGAMGTAGGLLHTVNHALFKALLFLGVGVVSLRTGQLDMYALGGLWRRMPVTFALMLVAAAGITGLPPFNGFVSKCLVHHALVAAQAAQGGIALRLAEGVYLLVCAGTVASFIKLIGLVFVAPARTRWGAEVREASPGMLVAMTLLACPVILLGLRPELLLKGMIAPGLAWWSMPHAAIDHYLAHYYLAPRDVLTAFATFGLGAAIFAIGTRMGVFHLRGPRWMSVARAYGAIARGSVRACVGTAFVYARFQHRLAWSLREIRRLLWQVAHQAGQARRRFVETVLAGVAATAEQAFLESAWLLLDEERVATTNAAASRLLEQARTDGAASPVRAVPPMESARAIAGLLAGALFEARLALLRRIGDAHGAAAQHTALDALYREFPATRAAIAAAAAELAPAHDAGEPPGPEVASILGPLLTRERLAVPAAWHPAPGAIEDGSADVPQLEFSLAAWLLDIGRLALSQLRQPLSARSSAETLDAQPGIVFARRKIQRYGRDISLNVATMFVLLVLLAGALWLGRSG
ncbi:complex I subunit 5 family protein [Wenzhouxiangella sp. XN24]|uniref:complex I subunit 5 family protein n=1 Tax=Wenzhouxiangella sp. XN24 TaxID=2713569 RepID=UPI0013EC40A2|nr:complex I subunit 5 family protein [Wenzhouxiangella sp. XN24]NGX15121.1 NADH dehydrogenase [Wenzhouxiangella sp. XN24]